MRSPTLDPARVESYVRDWLPHDPILPYVRERGLRVYSRSDLVRRDPAFGAQYLASPIHHEFYIPTKARDAIGIVRQGETFAQVMAFSETFAPAAFDEALPWLRLLEPAFLAGADAIFAVTEARESFARLVDTLPTPLGLWSPAGTRMHWNNALRAMLEAHPQRTAVERAMHELARQAARTPEAAGVRRVAGCHVAATLARHGVAGAPPLVVVRLVPLPGAAAASLAPEASPALAPAAALVASLSPRQRAVAQLIALGLDNAAVAERLGVTLHTAKRHTEQVLARLGVTSRRQAAALVTPLLTPDDSRTLP